MKEQTSCSRQLAEWCAALSWGDIPAEVRAHLPLRILDTVGLILVGAGTDAGKAALDFARNTSGPHQCTLTGLPGRVPPTTAVLVHGTAAHCRDFDDTFVDSVVHPGSVVIPVALALAEAHASSNQDFGAAVIAGYEVAARIGAVAGRRFHARSLHATGVVGPIAAAATAGRLLGLRGEQISWAMGLAASMSSGLMAFMADGGWSKWLHAGWAASGGIVAAELASRNFRGPEYVLNGGHDLYAALLHGETVDRSGLTADLGRSWKGALAEFKYYPCAHVIQPYIDAVLAIVRQYDLRPADIAAIECRIAPWAAAIVCEPREAKLRFDTELEAIASLPYQLAVAVTERRVDLGALAAGMRARAGLRALAERISHRRDGSLGKTFDGEVEVRTASGARYSGKASTAGADIGKLRGKFANSVGPILGPDRASAAAARLGSGEPDWKRAVDLLGGKWS